MLKNSIAKDIKTKQKWILFQKLHKHKYKRQRQADGKVQETVTQYQDSKQLS